MNWRLPWSAFESCRSKHRYRNAVTTHLKTKQKNTLLVKLCNLHRAKHGLKVITCKGSFQGTLFIISCSTTVAAVTRTAPNDNHLTRLKELTDLAIHFWWLLGSKCAESQEWSWEENTCTTTDEKVHILLQKYLLFVPGPPAAWH
jgi:hypothetical protein